MFSFREKLFIGLTKKYSEMIKREIEQTRKDKAEAKVRKMKEFFAKKAAAIDERAINPNSTD
jgi:hypothetical protein